MRGPQRDMRHPPARAETNEDSAPFMGGAVPQSGNRPNVLPFRTPQFNPLKRGLSVLYRMESVMKVLLLKGGKIRHQIYEEHLRRVLKAKRQLGHGEEVRIAA